MGSDKDGQPLVADLIRLRENESKLVQELAIEKAREQAQLQAAQRLKRLNLRNDLNEWIPQRKPTNLQRKLSHLLTID